VTAVVVLAVLAAAVIGALAWPRTRAENDWLAAADATREASQWTEADLERLRQAYEEGGGK